MYIYNIVFKNMNVDLAIFAIISTPPSSGDDFMPSLIDLLVVLSMPLSESLCSIRHRLNDPGRPWLKRDLFRIFA